MREMEDSMARRRSRDQVVAEEQAQFEEAERRKRNEMVVTEDPGGNGSSSASIEEAKQEQAGEPVGDEPQPVVEGQPEAVRPSEHTLRTEMCQRTFKCPLPEHERATLNEQMRSATMKEKELRQKKSDFDDLINAEIKEQAELRYKAAETLTNGADTERVDVERIFDFTDGVYFEVRQDVMQEVPGSRRAMTEAELKLPAQRSLFSGIPREEKWVDGQTAAAQLPEEPDEEFHEQDEEGVRILKEAEEAQAEDEAEADEDPEEHEEGF